jgi:sugar lactone lactonase YvrE
VFALAIGDVETALKLNPGEHPEGIAFDRNGNMYFGNRINAPGGGFNSRLRKITPGGKHDKVIATFAHSPGSALLGLVTDGDGDVWAAIHLGADHGVWRVKANGQGKTRIAGSNLINFPNALTFDNQGNLYVTDSGPVVPPVGGAIWVLRKGANQFVKWSTDAALAPLPFDPFGFPVPGANGIAFVAPNSLYVANTEKGQIVRIPINANGSAGAAVAVTGLFAVPTIDGIAVDVHGNIHGVLPGHMIVGAPPLVKVDATTGAVTRSSAAGFDGIYDIPLSLAFGRDSGDQTNVYVTNGDLPIAPVGQGPRILRVNVGVKGSK